MRKKIFSIWSILLVLVISIVVVIPGCGGDGVQYDLTIDSTAGGVTTPAEGTHTYDDGTVVDLVATPDCGYAFDVWTGDTDDIDNVNAAATNITMNADYSITANFKIKPLDHFKGYIVNEQTAPYMDQTVSLTDQFVEDFVVEVGEAWWFFNPTKKVHLGETTPISDDDHHLTVYGIDYEGDYPVMRSVEVTNQFGTQNVSVVGPVALAVPTTKVEPGNHKEPECLDHFLLYQVEDPEYIEEYVDLTDQFGSDENAIVYAPYYFANPVEKTVVGSGEVTEIEVGEHLLIYAMDGTTASYDQVQVDNQFKAGQTLDLDYPAQLLAVPSEKNVPPTPPLDHFKCYNTLGTALQLPVNLVDQFHYGYFDGVVADPIMFCNPVDKVHGTVTISSNDDNHLTVYKLTDTPTDYWTVTVDNQFNEAAEPQTLTVYGPVALAVPTQKVLPGDHGMPKYLDHYLLYEVWEPVPVDETVDLDDQFPGVAENVTVGPPIYFANPAIKGYLDYAPGFWDTDEHLVFYAISDNGEFYGDNVWIRNQFFPEEAVPLELSPVGQLLAVPSVKVEWAPTEPPIQ